MDNNDPSTGGGEAAEEKKEEMQPETQLLLLETLDDMLHNGITKEEIHNTQNRADITVRVWTEIETLHWVLGQSFCQKTNGE